MRTIDGRLAARAEGMQVSAIREILKVTQSSDVISLAGGLPAPEAFPVDIVKAICNKVLEEDPVAELQYGPSACHPQSLPAKAGSDSRCAAKSARRSGRGRREACSSG